jgi:hypothetical protein
MDGIIDQIIVGTIKLSIIKKKKKKKKKEEERSKKKKKTIMDSMIDRIIVWTINSINSVTFHVSIKSHRRCINFHVRNLAQKKKLSC